MLKEAGRTRRQATGLEFVLLIGALYALARTPLLFFRQRAANVVGGRISDPWMDDALIRGTFLIVELLIVVMAARACNLRSLCRHWVLIALLGVALLSTTWSVEPWVTAPRALMFGATAIVGWYLGQRFSTRQQAFIVAAVAALGALVSVVAVLIWPDPARSTSGYPDLWSGAYVHRNSLGLAMSTGLFALPFVLKRLRGAALAAGLGVGVLEAYLFWRSGSRTGLVAMTAAWGVVGFVGAVRAFRTRGMTLHKGAALTLAAAGVTGYGIHRNWAEVVSWFGRDTSLTSRVTIWAAVRQFIDRRPLTGWGFEAFWSYSPAIQDVAPLQFGSAHSGYYEILLGIGRIGFVFFVGFMIVTVWRVFVASWTGTGLESVWPLGLAVFVSVTNFSESFFVANEAQWALLVTAGVSAARCPSRRTGHRAENQAPSVTRRGRL